MYVLYLLRPHRAKQQGPTVLRSLHPSLHPPRGREKETSAANLDLYRRRASESPTTKWDIHKMGHYVGD